jgi:hypothetical protein
MGTNYSSDDMQKLARQSDLIISGSCLLAEKVSNRMTYTRTHDIRFYSRNAFLTTAFFEFYNGKYQKQKTEKAATLTAKRQPSVYDYVPVWYGSWSRILAKRELNAEPPRR